MVLALPFFSTAISGLFGWLLALIAARLRGNAPLTVLFSVVFLGLYMFYFSQANIYIQRLVLNGQAIAGALGSIVLLYWIGNAIVRLNSVHLIFSLLILLLPFALMYCLLSARFIRIATAKRGAVRVKYEMKAMRRSTRPSALFKRELKRFLSSPAYMLNSGLGILFIIAAAGALAVKKAAILALITQLGASGEQLVVIAVFALCLLTSTVMLTASSVSLEGKTLWAIRALPVPTRDILGAKLRLHIYMTAPAVVPASAALTYLLGPRVFDSLILLMAPVFFVMLSANIGLICNLYNVNLNWTNETQVIKQGISVLLAMLISSAAAFVPGLLYLLVPALSAHTLPFMAAYTISLLVGWRLSRSWIMTKGAEKFERLDS
jgi:ABC-2 type transport system permease protein